MSETQIRVGFIGGGRVTRLLAIGWHRASADPAGVLVHEPDEAAFARLAAAAPHVRRASAAEAAGADVVFLALHPPALGPALPAVRPHLSARALVVSLAPKIPLAALTAGLGTPRVARMIPNAPSIIGRGFNPVALGPGLDAGDRSGLATLFDPWGAWPEVAEADLEAYAILSGMGPTYYWYQWQALREVATGFGLTPERADEALRQTIQGALATLLESGLAPAEVMDLIPVRPLQGIEASVSAAYAEALPALHAKIRPAN
jgi:pyrroline-5-carboxylate reductase